MLAGLINFVEILQVKYLNNLIEQDHRLIKKITNHMMGFKAFPFHSAKATIDGIENESAKRRQSAPYPVFGLHVGVGLANRFDHFLVS
jgi:putative transposase